MVCQSVCSLQDHISGYRMQNVTLPQRIGLIEIELYIGFMYLRTHLLAYQCNQLNNAEGEGDQNDEVTWS